MLTDTRRKSLFLKRFENKPYSEIGERMLFHAEKVIWLKEILDKKKEKTNLKGE